MEVCNDCVFLDKRNKETSSYDRYWCNKKGGYHNPTERACGYFSYNFSSGSSNQGGWKPSGFSWITPLLDKLGNIFCSDCGIINTMAHYSLLFANLNPEYNEALDKALNTEEFANEDVGFFTNLATNFLLPWANALNLKNFEVAMDTFKNMIDYLLQKLGIIVKKEDYKALKRVNPNFIREGAC